MVYTTLETFLREKDLFFGCTIVRIVLDEAHYIFSVREKAHTF